MAVLYDDEPQVSVTIGGRVLPHEPSLPTKLKACAALLLKGEAFGMADAAEKLGWEPARLYVVTSPWCALDEGYECWVDSTREELATFLLFVAEAVRQG